MSIEGDEIGHKFFAEIHVASLLQASFQFEMTNSIMLDRAKCTK